MVVQQKLQSGRELEVSVLVLKELPINDSSYVKVRHAPEIDVFISFVTSHKNLLHAFSCFLLNI